MSSTLPSNASQFETAKPPRNGRPAIGGIVITVILALALIAIIVVAVTRLSSGNLARPSGATSATSASATSTTQRASSAEATAAAGTTADAATAATIQQVIAQVDAAQTQAIETTNSNVMAASATPEFYQEQVATNQNLADAGVTDIKLVNIEWGPITVNGDTASATNYETWSTTFSDGTTEQSRDRNVYTLVHDNGTWKVQADEHPDQTLSGQ